jgi:hypothetical protein
MTNAQRLLSKIITFGTIKCDHSPIHLVEELDMIINCFLNQISNKKIRIIKKNFADNIIVYQTKSKNLLILFSIFHHFMINMPPQHQLSITIERNEKNNIKVMFCDCMPFWWRSIEQKENPSESHNPLLLTFDKLMYACMDEEITVKQGNNGSGNYFILEYQFKKGQNRFNLIQGDFNRKSQNF